MWFEITYKTNQSGGVALVAADTAEAAFQELWDLELKHYSSEALEVTVCNTDEPSDYDG